MQTLPAYRAYLSGRYAAKTISMYWGDVRELSVYLKDRKLEDITTLDLQLWVDVLMSNWAVSCSARRSTARSAQ